MMKILSYIRWRTAPLLSHPTQHRALSGIDTIAENKIAEWLHNKGDQGLKKKGMLPTDRHQHLSRTLGVQDDYIHSKILADNNIKPLSVQRRIELDSAWEKVKMDVRHEYEKSQLAIDEFIEASTTKDRFQKDIDRLDRMAKACNDAIISDSMRFNGRSPVRHARRFTFEERLREAILG
jgi:hypothetical protein